MSDQRPSWWVSGDWNGFFGLGTNVLLNMLVLTGILFAIQMPPEVIFGRILPAVGLMLFLGNMYYAWMAKRLGERQGRGDVTALPSGPSVPHMFFVVFVIMLPIKLKTGDPIMAWHAGLAWVFIEGVVLFLGAFVAPTIRRLTPRAALLGTLAGISITFISMQPALRMMDGAIIGLISFAIILGAWYGGVRYPGRIPGGLVAIAVGTVLAWISYLAGWDLADLTPAGVGKAVGDVGFNYPIPAIGAVFSGLAQFWGFILVTAIPFGIYDFVEAMDNVESAAAAGDEYDTREAIGAEGIISLIGTFLGSPFANAVYIGHPGWKAIGGRIGYSVGTGVMVLVLTWLTIVPLMLSVIPLVAIIPILLYIGVLIGSQAFQATPIRHAPAVVLALVPNLALWLKTRVDGALQAAGWNPGALTAEQIGALGNNGVLYRGLEILSGGAIVTGLLWGAMAAFMLDRKHDSAAVFALIAAILTFFGFIHGPSVGWMVTPVVALAYLIVAGILFWFTRLESEPAGVDESRPDSASA